MAMNAGEALSLTSAGIEFLFTPNINRRVRSASRQRPALMPGVSSSSTAFLAGLERVQEADKLIFLSLGKLTEPFAHELCLALVPLDGVLQSEGLQIVHEPWAHA